MHPPDTDPTTDPSSHSAMMEPTGRGEEPHVRTTVASNARRPAGRQPCSVRNTITSRFSIVPSPIHFYRLFRYSHLRPPRLTPRGAQASATADTALPGHRRRPPQGEDAKRLRGRQMISHAISTSAPPPPTHPPTP